MTTCGACGLVQADGIIPSESLYEAYMELEDPGVDEESAGRKLSFRRDILKCASLAPLERSEILEAGAFTGIAADAFKEVLPGAVYTGIEPSRWACAVARKRGHNVIQGKVGDRLGRRFDIVFSWDVIEHLEHPREFFEWCDGLTGPGAHLFISTPNWDSPWRKAFGRRWWFIEPMHRTFFSPGTMSGLAGRHGWRVIRVWPHTKVLSLNYLAGRAAGELGLDLKKTARLLPGLNIPLRLGQMSVLLKRP